MTWGKSGQSVLFGDSQCFTIKWLELVWVSKSRTGVIDFSSDSVSSIDSPLNPLEIVLEIINFSNLDSWSLGILGIELPSALDVLSSSSSAVTESQGGSLCCGVMDKRVSDIKVAEVQCCS
jgi:hypothetical protein